MIRRAILPAMLIVGMLMTVGVAVAAIGSNDDSGSSTTLAGASSGTTSTGALRDDDGTTSTTTRGSDDRTTSTTTPGGDGRTTSTTAPGSDDGATSTTTPATTKRSTDSSTPGQASIVIPAPPAGSITVAVVDGNLTLVSTDISADWTKTRERIRPDNINLKFDNGSTELEIEAELDNGRVKWDVTLEPHASATSTTSTTSTTVPGSDDSEKSSPPPSGPIVVDASPAGSITVAVSDGRLSLVATDISADWTKTGQEIESDRIKLKFLNGSTELEIEVELDDGTVKWDVEFETYNG